MDWHMASNYAEQYLPIGMRRWLRQTLFPAWMGSLRRGQPVSNNWGFDRGRPVDRYYIESFLESHRSDIRGRVLEIMNSDYTMQFGTAVEAAEVLDVDPAYKTRIYTERCVWEWDNKNRRSAEICQDLERVDPPWRLRGEIRGSD